MSDIKIEYPWDQAPEGTVGACLSTVGRVVWFGVKPEFNDKGTHLQKGQDHASVGPAIMRYRPHGAILKGTYQERPAAEPTPASIAEANKSVDETESVPEFTMRTVFGPEDFPFPEADWDVLIDTINKNGQKLRDSMQEVETEKDAPTYAEFSGATSKLMARSLHLPYDELVKLLASRHVGSGIMNMAPGEELKPIPSASCEKDGHLPIGYNDDIGTWCEICGKRLDEPKKSPSLLESVIGFLDKAAEEPRKRAQYYDAPGGENSMPKIVEIFNTLTGHKLSEVDGWTFMQILKMVRSRQGDYREDNHVDEIAYAAFKASAAERIAQENEDDLGT